RIAKAVRAIGRGGLLADAARLSARPRAGLSHRVLRRGETVRSAPGRTRAAPGAAIRRGGALPGLSEPVLLLPPRLRVHRRGLARDLAFARRVERGFREARLAPVGVDMGCDVGPVPLVRQRRSDLLWLRLGNDASRSRVSRDLHGKREDGAEPDP